MTPKRAATSPTSSCRNSPAKCRGKGGGFVLVLPADAISFKDVLTAVDAFPTKRRCAFGRGDCNAARPCPLHDKWTAMSDEFRDWATRTTFAELGDLSHSRVDLGVSGLPPG